MTPPVNPMLGDIIVRNCEAAVDVLTDEGFKNEQSLPMPQQKVGVFVEQSYLDKFMRDYDPSEPLADDTMVVCKSQSTREEVGLNTKKEPKQEKRAEKNEKNLCLLVEQL